MLLKGDRRFFVGLCAGLSSALFVVSFGVTSFLLLRGFRLSIDQEELALAVQEKARAEARRQLPDFLLQFEEQIPTMVQDMVPDKISLDLEQSKIEIPPAVISAMREEIGRLTRESIKGKLGSLDLTAYSDRLAEMAYDLVKTTLETEVNGRTFHVRANRWMSIPVTVMSR